MAESEVIYRLVGARIRATRETIRPRLSQETLAKRLGMSRVSIVNIEAGRQHAPLHVLWAIAAELGVEAAELVPTRAEYQQAIEPVVLDDDAIASIEAAANGDAVTKENLMEFISRAKARLGSNEESGT